MNNNYENCPIQHLIYPLTAGEWAEVLEWFEGSKKELHKMVDNRKPTTDNIEGWNAAIKEIIG